MLKAKIGRQNSNSSLNITENVEIVAEQPQKVAIEELSQRQEDLCRGIDGNLGKLDSLIDRAEMAHNSMYEQRKQMNKFLK